MHMHQWWFRSTPCLTSQILPPSARSSRRGARPPPRRAPRPPNPRLPPLSCRHAAGAEAGKGRPRFLAIQEAPAVIQSYYNKRIVGCPGGEGEDEHEVVWFWLEKGKPHECPVCTQYFTLDVFGEGLRLFKPITLLGLLWTLLII